VLEVESAEQLLANCDAFEEQGLFWAPLLTESQHGTSSGPCVTPGMDVARSGDEVRLTVTPRTSPGLKVASRTWGANVEPAHLLRVGAVLE
jgi:hypothetical protein